MYGVMLPHTGCHLLNGNSHQILLSEMSLPRVSLPRVEVPTEKLIPKY